MLTLARAVGVLCSLALIVGGAAALYSYARRGELGPELKPEQQFQFKGKAKGLEKMPALAMEFLENESEVKGFLDQPVRQGEPNMREKLRGTLAADNIFIASYSLLFAGLCVLLTRRRFLLRGVRFACWLAVFAAVCAAGAAIADMVENAHTTTLLDAAAVTKPLVSNVASASFAKWVLSALTTLSLSPVFLWGGVGWARRFGIVLFLLYLASGVLTLLGILGGQPSLVAAAFKLNIPSVLIIAFVFTLRPQWVAGES